MKRFALAVALAFVLSGSASAGEIHSTEVTAPGDMPGVGSVSPGEMPVGGSTSPGEIPTCDLSIVLTILKLAF